MDDPQGPYEPTWKNRRIVTWLWLGQTAVALHLDWFGIYDISENVQYSLIGICGLLLSYYLIGPAWEGVKTWSAFMEKRK